MNTSVLHSESQKKMEIYSPFREKEKRTSEHVTALNILPQDKNLVICDLFTVRFLVDTNWYIFVE